MSEKAVEEKLLIERAKHDPEAFGILYERYVDKIYTYIYYKVGNKVDAEDLTAKTFFKALDHIKNYQDRGLPFYAWLHRIAHNLVANWHRDRSRRKVISLDALIPKSSPGPEPLELLEEEERKEALLAAIKRLPPDRQELLYLKFAERLTNQEIAQVMGKTESAIKSLYHRTLVALRKELEDKGAL
ncbi:MAG TPA: sigma-70 family RNA polymerase sigma factor [Chloroflexi bacterium]|nr:sigma-70 family RNA polymerase sigma factor [Chloroflexota bacterium]